MIKFLVVDDEPSVVSLLKDFLTEKGYAVHTAYNGKEALELYTREQPKIVFLDIRMPGVDGLEILRTLKEKNDNLKIIMITVVEDQTTIDMAKSLGADEYIVKPFDLDYLEKVIIKKVSETLTQKDNNHED